MTVHIIIRVILLAAFVGNTASVSCMTEEPKKSTKKTVLTSEADLLFYSALEKALDAKDSKLVEQAFKHAREASADIKQVMSITVSDVEDGEHNYLHRAIKKACSLKILKFLKEQGVEVWGIEHKSPTLRTACLQWEHPEQEAIIKWLVEQDPYVPGGAECVRFGAVSLLGAQTSALILQKFCIEALRDVSRITRADYDLRCITSISRWFMEKKKQ